MRRFRVVVSGRLAILLTRPLYRLDFVVSYSVLPSLLSLLSLTLLRCYSCQQLLPTTLLLAYHIPLTVL